VIVTKSDAVLNRSLELGLEYFQGFHDKEYGLRDSFLILLHLNVAVNCIMLIQLFVEKRVKSVAICCKQRVFFLVLDLLHNFNSYRLVLK
jgi:hypothetical protein